MAIQLNLHQVGKTYSVGGQAILAVRNATVDVRKGDFLSIVGHSGSGKTTLLSMIGGITSPTSGTIRFEEQDITRMDGDGLSAYRSDRIGFMFQFSSLLPLLTVRENLLLPTVFTRQPENRTDSQDRVQELLSLVGLSDKIDAYPARLSGGQQRRIAIARAFMNRPALILADEPTGDLDEETELAMMVFFQEMNVRHQTTFIMVTHNTDLARKAQRQFRMQQGELIAL